MCDEQLGKDATFVRAGSHPKPLAFMILVVLAVAFACMLSLPQNAWADTETVTGADNSVGSKLTSHDGAVTYTILTRSTDTANGTVTLSSVSSAVEGDYVVCDTITHGGLTYDVVAISPDAFNSSSNAAANITSLYIPASVTSLKSRAQITNEPTYFYLYRCTSLTSVKVDENNPAYCAVDNILFTADKSILLGTFPNNEAIGGDEGYIVPAETVQVGDYAFSESTTLKGITFAGDLTASTSNRAIGSHAFSGCASLEWVAFPEKVASINDHAFSDCTALKSVAFPDNALVYSNPTVSKTYSGFGSGAFENCTALESIMLPACINGIRRGDYYYKLSQYSPFSIFQSVGDEDHLMNIPSGYYNGSLYGGANFVEIEVIAGGANGGVFKDCTALKDVVFRAGAPGGMYSYATTAGNSFEGCTNLESLVFEGADQPYWMDPNRSLNQASYKDYWSGWENTPTYYYAVDYYLTDDLSAIDGIDYPENTPEHALSSDIYEVASDLIQYSAPNRLARVEYARDTPISAITISNTEMLEKYTYANVSDYVREGYSDGVIPNPNEAAYAAFGEEALSIDWVWKLTNTQSRRASLTESCAAYLAPASDISTGRIEADQISVEYKLCDQNLSRGFLPDGEGQFAFSEDVGYDPQRGASESSSTYRFSGSLENFDDGATPYFTLTSSLENSFYDVLDVVTGDGAILDFASDDYSAEFQYYDSDAGELIDCELGEFDGPVLMTIVPSDTSGYTGTLREWVFVEGHSGSVREMYTDTSAETARKARYYQGEGTPSQVNQNVGLGTYPVYISSADASSALVATSYAGLTGSGISTQDDSDASYGFAIQKGSTSGSWYASSEGRTPAEFAVAVYEAFEHNRNSIGIRTNDYPWSNRAILISPNTLSDVAAAAGAYAYAQKAPIFYLDEDGQVSKDTLTCLKDFSHVVVIGDTALVSDSILNDTKEALGDGAVVERIAGDAGSSASLSIAVARTLSEEGLINATNVTISDATDPIDAISALELSGRTGGITLSAASTAESKEIISFLRGYRDDIDHIRLFGRDASNIASDTFSFYDLLGTIWNERGGYTDPVIGIGDTLALYGAVFDVGKPDNEGIFPLTISETGRLWKGCALEAGSIFSFAGERFVLLDDVKGTVPSPIEITSAMFNVDTTYGIYDGSTPVTKSITSDLTEGIDYTVTYTNNNKAGEATITITGIGDYEGELTYTFKIIHYFEDVWPYSEGNNWYFDAVYGMVDLGAITGYNESTFGVGDAMSRAQLVTIMWRYCEPEEYANYDEPNAKDTTGLPDAQNGMYYTGAVNWAYANGVITGNLQSDGTYTLNPDDPVTFDQMVTILARYVLGFDGAADYNTSFLNNGNFTDKDAVQDFARGAMSWAIENEVVTGNNNGDGTFTLDPTSDVARERATTVLYRSIDEGLLVISDYKQDRRAENYYVR